MMVRYKGEQCIIEFSKYQVNGNTAITLLTNYGQPMAVATINLGTLKPNLVAIKNYSENEGIEEFLIKNDIIKTEPIHYIDSGYVSIPVYELTEKSINMINEEV